MAIHFDGSTETRTPEAIFEGLEANLVWSTDADDQKTVKHVLSHFKNMKKDNILHIYSIWRSDNIHDFRIVKITRASINVFKYSSELDYMERYFNPLY